MQSWLSLLLLFLIDIAFSVTPRCSDSTLVPSLKLAISLQNSSLIQFSFPLPYQFNTELQVNVANFCYKLNRLLINEEGQVMIGCEDGLVRQAKRILRGEATEEEWLCLPAQYQDQMVNSQPSSPFLAQILLDRWHLNLTSMDEIVRLKHQNVSFCQLIRQYSSDALTLDLLHSLPHLPEPPIQRVLCIVYTIEPRHREVEGIVNTWGGRCSGFLAFSNKTDLMVPTISIPHEGEESYENLWAKIVSVWRYVYEHYRDEFDWFYLAGDDTYLLTENLLEYLNTFFQEEIQGQGLFLGRRFYSDDFSWFYNTGGAGYAMNKIALFALYQGLTDPADPCNTKAVTSAEDVYVAACLRKYGIHAIETRDALYGDRERFHHFTPAMSWMFAPEDIRLNWWSLHTLEFRNGSDCCSPRSISFHYIKKLNYMLEIDAFLRMCKT